MSAGANLFVGGLWVAIYLMGGEPPFLWTGTFLIGLGLGRMGERGSR